MGYCPGCWNSEERGPRAAAAIFSRIDAVGSGIGSTFALGVSTVHGVAADRAGDTHTCTIQVTVVDTTPRVLQLVEQTTHSEGPSGFRLTQQGRKRHQEVEVIRTPEFLGQVPVVDQPQTDGR